MLTRILRDIEIALDNDAYFAALGLVLTLPDICGKAEYPHKNTGERYKQWYNEYVGQYERCPCEICKQNPMPYLSGEVVYSLRNSLLHQGTPNIDSRNIKESVNKMDEFVLVLEQKNEFNVYADASGVITQINGAETFTWKRNYRVNVRRLCFVVTSAANSYFQRNRAKFDFFNYSILELTS